MRVGRLRVITSVMMSSFLGKQMLPIQERKQLLLAIIWPQKMLEHPPY